MPISKSPKKRKKKAALMFYLIAFGSGLSGVPWVVNSEIYPLEVRQKCNGQVMVCCWLMSFFVSATFLHMLRAWGPEGTFGFYGGMAVLGLLVLYQYMPETKGKTLESIEKLFL